MKRWEPIKTEKKQLGGIIKFLLKVAPKLASKAKGRVLASRFRQVKDFKTPYIFPGQLGWSPAETRTVWHRTNNPIILESYYKPFREAWSTGKVKGNKATSYFFKWQPDQKFELVKNIEPNNYSVHFKTDRNALSYGNKMALFAKIADEIPEGALLSTYGSISKGGIHGLERFGKDFGFNLIGTRLLIMKGTQEPVVIPILLKPLFKTKKRMQIPEKDRPGFIIPTASTIMPLKNLSLLDSPEYRLLLLLRIWEEADSGRRFLREYLKSPKWGERASKHMSRQEAYNLGNFESLLLSSHNPPEGFKPLYSRLELLNNGASGQSVMPYKSKQSYREIQIDPNNAVAPRYTGVHESAHMSNLNYTPFNGYKHYKELFPEELQPLLDKLLANAKKLADQLEIDPKRYKESVDFVAKNRNISTLDAKNLIDNWILYLKDPGEVRARGLAAVAYSRTMHTKDIPKEVDGGLGIFTKESLDNLYRNIFSIGTPIGVGLYATQN